ncbi:MAG: helix-turn-helix domain-containing protein [Candidatus Thorarchaeota archaeon]
MDKAPHTNSDVLPDSGIILAQRLKQRLREKNKTFRQCAKETGLSLSTIAKLASGERGLKPRQSTIYAIADALETTPGWLTGQERVSVRTVVAALHHGAIHAIRSAAVSKNLSLGTNFGQLADNFGRFADAYEFLATKCRQGFAAAIGLEANRLQCSIKLCKTAGDKRASSEVWTLARSEVYTSDPSILYSNLRKKITQTWGNNSASAALIGCSDRNTNWVGQYNCFCCNDLTKHPEYVNARLDWSKFYKSAMVFPLRWSIKGENELRIRGFLAFDSMLTNIYKDAPCIFEYKDSPNDYYIELCESVAYHVGGIIADCLATTIALANEGRD